MSIILASASPRRRELLTQIGLEFQVVVSNVEEKVTATAPAAVVEELSAQKAEGVLEMSFRSLYITAAVCGFIRALIKNRKFFMDAGKKAHKTENTLAKTAAADLTNGEDAAS